METLQELKAWELQLNNLKDNVFTCSPELKTELEEVQKNIKEYEQQEHQEHLEFLYSRAYLNSKNLNNLECIYHNLKQKVKNFKNDGTVRSRTNITILMLNMKRITPILVEKRISEI